MLAPLRLMVAGLCLLTGAALAQTDGAIVQTPLDSQSGGAGENFNPDIDPSEPDYTEEAPLVDAPKARLRGLDTLTNTVNDFEIRVGETLADRQSGGLPLPRGRPWRRGVCVSADP